MLETVLLAFFFVNFDEHPLYDIRFLCLDLVIFNNVFMNSMLLYSLYCSFVSFAGGLLPSTWLGVGQCVFRLRELSRVTL